MLQESLGSVTGWFYKYITCFRPLLNCLEECFHCDAIGIGRKDGTQQGHKKQSQVLKTAVFIVQFSELQTSAETQPTA